MKRSGMILFITGFLLIFQSVFAKTEKKGYSIKVQVHGIKDTTVYLARYYGPKQYYRDTTNCDSKGRFEFSGDDTLQGGIYSIIIPGPTYFEFIVNDERFSMETSKDKLIEDMIVKDSYENEIFFNWLKFINTKHKEANPIRNTIKALKEDTLNNHEDSLKELYQKIKILDDEVLGYQKKVISENNGSLVTKIFSSTPEPDIPEAPVLANGRKDSTFAYKYLIKHYFDNVDMGDRRLLYTPIIHNKVSRFISQLTPQIPDSINKAIDYVVELSNADKEIFKYVVSWILNHYAQSKVMGMDDVYVHMADNYYISGRAYWVDSTTLYKITERATAIKPTLIGKIAPNLVLKDVNGSWQSLKNINSKFIVLCFWDPDCGHCKKEIPKLKEMIDKIKTDKDVKVFSVCTEVEKEKWIKFLETHNLLDWINVADIELRNNFREIYDISSTPRIFLLDQNKKILAKQLSIEQLEEYIILLSKKDAKKEVQN